MCEEEYIVEYCWNWG